SLFFFSSRRGHTSFSRDWSSDVCSSDLKRLFNSLLLLSRLQQWQKMTRSMNTGSKWTLPEENLTEYLDLAREAALSVLCRVEEKIGRASCRARVKRLTCGGTMVVKW